MSRRSVPIALAALSLGVSAAAQARHATGVQTFALPGPGISFQLPLNWRKAPTPAGWRFLAKARIFTASVYVNEFPSTLGGRAFRKNVIAFERKAALGFDPHATVTVTDVRVASEPAFKITARYGPLTAYLYGFKHGGKDYMVEYIADTPSLKAARRVFAASLRSIRFLAPA